MTSGLSSVKAKLKSMRHSAEAPARRSRKQAVPSSDSDVSKGHSEKGPINDTANGHPRSSAEQSAVDGDEMLLVHAASDNAASHGVTEAGRHLSVGKPLPPEETVDEAESVYDVLGSLLAGKIRRPSVSTSDPSAMNELGRPSYRPPMADENLLELLVEDNEIKLHPPFASTEGPPGASPSRQTPNAIVQIAKGEADLHIDTVVGSSLPTPPGLTSQNAVNKSQLASGEVDASSATSNVAVQLPPRHTQQDRNRLGHVAAGALFAATAYLIKRWYGVSGDHNPLALDDPASARSLHRTQSYLVLCAVLCSMTYGFRRVRNCYSKTQSKSLLSDNIESTVESFPAIERSPSGDAERRDPSEQETSGASDVTARQGSQLLRLAAEDKELLRAAQTHTNARQFRTIFGRYRLHPFRAHLDDDCPDVKAEDQELGQGAARLGERAFLRDLFTDGLGAYIGSQTVKGYYDSSRHHLNLNLYIGQLEADAPEKYRGEGEHWKDTITDIKAVLKYLHEQRPDAETPLGLSLLFRPVSEWSQTGFRTLIGVGEQDLVRKDLKRALELAAELEQSLAVARNDQADDGLTGQVKEILEICQPDRIGLSCMPHRGWQRPTAGSPFQVQPGPSKFVTPFSAIERGGRESFVAKPLSTLALHDALPFDRNGQTWGGFAFRDWNIRRLEIRLCCSAVKHPDCHAQLADAILSSDSGIRQMLSGDGQVQALAVLAESRGELTCFRAAFKRRMHHLGTHEAAQARAVQERCVVLWADEAAPQQSVWPDINEASE